MDRLSKMASFNSVESDTVPEMRRFGRDSRSASQDDLDSPQIATFRKALANFDATAIDDLAKKGYWTADSILDPQKFRNPLHTLVVLFTAACETGTQVGLAQKFQDCLSVILEHGVDINEGDVSRNTPLHLLCQQCGMDAPIQMLLASGAKVNLTNANEQTPLHLACDEGTFKDVEALLTGGADSTVLDCMSMSPLHYAVKYRRNLEAIKCLVECGAGLDLQARQVDSIWGPTALHMAVRSDRKENVKLLLELGANPDLEDSSGQTPIHLAASYDITGAITKMLIQGKANIDYKDKIRKETAIHKAIKKNMVENVKILCSEGASLSATDFLGDSPLHCAAACCQNMDIWVVLLSAAQADIRIRNSKGQTLMNKASRSSNKLAVNVLKQVEG